MLGHKFFDDIKAYQEILPLSRKIVLTVEKWNKTRKLEFGVDMKSWSSR